LGQRVLVKKVSERFPNPSKGDLAGAARVLASISTGAVVIVDGLAAGAMPRLIEHEAGRLRFVGLIPHPLAHETGVSRTNAVRLWAQEMWALQHARHVVVTSPRTAKLLLREYCVKPAQLSCIEPGTERWPAAHGPRCNALLCVATLTPRKGHVTLI